MALTTTVDYLIPDLQIQIGDIDGTVYMTTTLTRALLMSIKALGSWWNFKYLIDSSDNVYRNTRSIAFLFPEPNVIENQDERPIVLLASIILKSSTMESNSANYGSWRDYEVSYSNIESSRAKDTSIQRDIDELFSIITPPSKKLARAKKNSLLGYIDNIFEREGKY